MQTSLKVANVIYDDMEVIKKCIDNHEAFQLTVFHEEEGDEDDDGELKDMNIWLEAKDQDKACTIMFNMTYPEAYMLAKTLITMIKSGNKKWINERRPI